MKVVLIVLLEWERLPHRKMWFRKVYRRNI